MRTEQVLDRIRWMEDQFRPIQEFIEGALPRLERLQKNLVIAADRIGRFAHTVEQSPDAVQVLKAFSLDDLLDGRLTGKMAETTGPEDSANLIFDLRRRTTLMFGCLKPLLQLTTPAVNIPDNEARLDINVIDRPSLSAKEIGQIFFALQGLYEAVAEVIREIDAEPLEIIKVESGTDVRISLKGSGETIKELKDFVLEMWGRFRHKKADEVLIVSKAATSNFALFEQLEQMRKKGVINEEHCNRMKTAVFRKTLDLFDHGALPSEIPAVETIDNGKLLSEGLTPKMLPPPNPTDGAAVSSTPPAPAAPSSGAQRPRKKRSRK
jgi:hypothetical protein